MTRLLNIEIKGFIDKIYEDEKAKLMRLTKSQLVVKLLNLDRMKLTEASNEKIRLEGKVEVLKELIKEMKDCD